jgi:DNA-binding NarL/FixJ family response regulator
MKKILIIDDDKIFTKILKDALIAQEGMCEVALAYDGEEGLLEAQRYHPDLIVLDLKMPKLGGIEFLRELKLLALEPQIPILVSTQLSTPETISEGIELGIAGYVVKSDYSLETIVAQINKILQTNQ